MTTPKNWAWFKDKWAEVTVQMVSAGMLLLISLSIIVSATNEYRRAADRDAIEKDLIKRHNATVTREGGLVQEVEQLKQDIEKLKQEIEKLKQDALHPPPNFSIQNNVPLAPSNSFMPAPAIHPAQKRLDWEKSNRE